jgi:L-iditol 2-dehydrogenase
LRPGDLVAVDPAISCGHCDQCRTDRPHTCRELRFLGCPGQIEGCLADFLVMPEACCFRVPDGLSPDAAAFAEPLSIGIYAARLAGSLGGAAAAVLGCGPIGLCVLLAARAAGARALYASDPVAARRGAAAACGADWTAGPEGLDRPDALADLEPLQLDAVFECCGRQEALDQAVALLKPGGRLMVVGIPAKDRVSFPIDLLRRREIRIVNVRRQCECVPAALESLAAGRVPLASLVTHHFAPGRVAEAFDLAAGYGDGLIKAMIDFD